MPSLEVSILQRSTQVLRSAALVLLVGAGLASIVASGGGDGSGEYDPVTPDNGRVTVSGDVVVTFGIPVTVRVDLAGQVRTDAATGYAFNLDEVTSKIRVTTEPCPAGVGTDACQDWTFEAEEGAVTGIYDVGVSPIGTRYRYAGAGFNVTVLRPISAGAEGASQVASSGNGLLDDSALVIDAAGRLWGRGSNRSAQLRTAYEAGAPLPDGDLDPRFFNSTPPQPGRLAEFALVDTRTDWVDIATLTDIDSGSSFGVRSDGTLWGWGDNRYGELGMSSPGRFVRTPTRVPNITAGRVLSVSGGLQGIAARLDNGQVFVLGNRRAFGPANEPVPAIPISASVPTLVPNLDNVIAVSGGSRSDGMGFAAALKADGSVWVWGYREGFLTAQNGTFKPEFYPRRVNALPAGITAIAALASGPRLLALAADGFVRSIDIDDNDGPPLQVGGPNGLTDVTSITAAGAYGYARRRDGSVWLWPLDDPSAAAPVAGLDNATQVVAGFALRDVCGNSPGNELFRLTGSGPLRELPFDTLNNAACPQATLATLDLTVQGPGTGTVFSSPPSFACLGAACQGFFPTGTEVRLHAVGNHGASARIVGGDCVSAGLANSGPSWFDVTMNGPKTCAIRFDEAPAPLRTLNVTVSGQGSVTSQDGGIACGADCEHSYAFGTQVVLSAVPAGAGFVFAGWTGHDDCADSTLTIDANKSCTATFTPAAPALATLRLVVVGNGQVSATSPGLSDFVCTSTCEFLYPLSAVVTLSATPTGVSTFGGWSGDASCGAATLTMSVARQCNATFAAPLPSGWQSLGPPLAGGASATAISLAIDRSNPASPVIYTATTVNIAGGRYELVVQRFDGVTWHVVGSGAVNADTLLSTFRFVPAITVVGGVPVVAWPENGERVRVKRWNGSDWVTLADNLNLDPALSASGVQLTGAGNEIVVAWVEGSTGIGGRMALKRYDTGTQQWTGGAVLPAETNVLAVRLAHEAPGTALLMMLPYSPNPPLEGPLRILREAAGNTWTDVCSAGVAPPPANFFSANMLLGFGVARSAASAETVAVVHNGEAVFVRACRGGTWVGLDGSELGRVTAPLLLGESMSTMGVAQGVGSGVALVWSKVGFLTGGGIGFWAQVLVENSNATAMVAGGSEFSTIDDLGQVRRSLPVEMAAPGSPVIATSVLEPNGGGHLPRVFRFVP